jgi:hypothetical protein
MPANKWRCDHKRRAGGEESLTTADLAATGEIPTAQREIDRDRKEAVIENQTSDARNEDEQLAPLFLPDAAKDFRSRWDAVQRGFVDDPGQSELVAQVMKSLAEAFSNERAKLESSSGPNR